MDKRWMGLLAWCWSATLAAAPLVTDRPVTWNGGRVKLGDSESEVRRTAGKYPDRAVPLAPTEAVPLGEQWMFIDGAGKQTLWVELIGGRVTRVWTDPLDAKSNGTPDLK